MRNAIAIGLVLGSLVLTAPISLAAPQEAKKEKPAKTKNASANSSLTGCIDQQSGHYVLTDDRNLNPVVDLVASGFPEEGFAKYLGHKVTVRGSSAPAGARAVFRVTSVTTVSDTCVPEQ